MIKKNKGDFNEEINRLRSALLAWICGNPLNLIESIPIGAPVRGESLPNARELGNSLAPRTFAFLLGTVGGLARAIAEHAGDEVIGPAVLESLYVTIQKGYDSPSKLVWRQNNPELHSRVQVHLDYRMNAGDIDLDDSDDLAEIRRKVEAAIAGRR
jgi:hypothetical protein